MTTALTLSQRPQEKPSMVINKLLASGKFPVYHAHSPVHKVEYALKMFPQDEISLTLFSKEVKTLAMLAHPNIVKYLSHSKLKISNAVECNVLFLEYAPYGDFYDLVMSNKLKGDERLSRHYFRQLIDGLEYLHSQHGVAHCDLKLENLLIGKDYGLKIADFDHARTSQDNKTSLHGTEGYRAPEVMEGTCQDVFAADMYSVGVLLYILITGQMPFAECGNANSKILEDYDEFCESNEAFWNKKSTEHKQASALLNEDFRILIKGLLARKPEDRLTIEQIKDSKWFNGQLYSKEDLEIRLKTIFGKY